MIKMRNQIITIASLAAIMIFSQNFTLLTASNTIVIPPDATGVYSQQKVMQAFQQLLAQTGPATLIFPKDQIIYIKRPESLNAINANEEIKTRFIFKIQNKNDLVIDGNGSKLIFDPYDLPFLISESSNITIKNLKISYSRSHFIQGDIVGVGDKFLDLKVDAGYYSFPHNSMLDFSNSSTFDENGKFLRNINMFIKGTQSSQLGSEFLRVFVDDAYLSDLKNLKVNYRFSFGTFKKYGRTFELQNNRKLIQLQNIEINRGSGGGVLANDNEGELVFDGIKVKREPVIPLSTTTRTQDLLVFQSDAFHIFYNRAKVTIKNSEIERISDDGINIASMAEVATRIISDREFELRSTALGTNISPELRTGDTISAYSLGLNSSNYHLGTAKIVAIKNADNSPYNLTARRRIVVLDKNIPGVKVTTVTSDAAGGQMFDDDAATRFFIKEMSNPGFVIVNNSMRDKHRNGILAKGDGGLIRANRFENIAGHGIYASNIVKFNEGPSPTNLEISANTFDGIALTALIIGFSSVKAIPNSYVLSDSIVVNNTFLNTDDLWFRTQNLTSLNHFGNSIPALSPPPQHVNSSNISSAQFTPLFRLPNDTGFYFTSGLNYCRLGSMDRVRTAWGSNYIDYVSNLKSVPNSRVFSGFCKLSEALFSINNTGLGRGEADGSFCSFKSMRNFINITGITDASNLILQTPNQTLNAAELKRCDL